MIFLLAFALAFVLIHYIGSALAPARNNSSGALIMIWSCVFVVLYMPLMMLGEELAMTLSSWFPAPVASLAGLLVFIGFPGAISAALAYAEWRSRIVFRSVLVGTILAICLTWLMDEIAVFGTSLPTELGIFAYFSPPLVWNACFAFGVAREVRTLRHAADQSHCPHCGYSLEGLPSNACPECGHTLTEFT